MPDNNDDITSQIKDAQKLGAELKKQKSEIDNMLATQVGILGRVSKAWSSATKQAAGYIDKTSELIKINTLIVESKDQTAELNKIVNATTASIKKLARDGKTDALAAAAGIDALADSAATAAKQAEAIRQALKNASVTMVDQEKTVASLRQEYENLKIAIGDVNKASEKDKDLLKEREQALIAAEQSLESTVGTVKNLATSYKSAQEAQVQSNQEMLSGIKRMSETNIELRKMQGGFSGTLAHIQGMASPKIWEWVDKLSTAALVYKGFALLNEALVMTSSYLKVNNKLARQFGESSIHMGTALMEATASARSFAVTASELGMPLEEVQAIGDRIRIGIKLDAQGRIGEAGVRKLTKAVAQFAAYTGIEATMAADMMEFRMRSMNMTADQAAADMAGLRVQMEQMAVGIGKNNLPMDELVDLLNKASQESQSFVVDTRIMTQGLRAAADQATRLGASQKLAKQTADAFAKTMNTTAEHVVIPAANKMVEMLDRSPETFTANMTESQKKLAKEIRDMYKSGQVNMFEAGKMLMENFGNSAAGMQAKLEELMKYRGSPMAGVLAKEWGLAESVTAGRMMMENFAKAQDRAKDIQQYTGQSIPAVQLMADNAGRFEEALKDAKTDIDKMDILQSKLGLNAEDAKKYLQLQKQYAGNHKQLIAVTEAHLHRSLDPMVRAKTTVSRIAELKKQGKSDEEITKMLTTSLGIASDEGKASLAKTVRDFNKNTHGANEELIKNLVEGDSKSLEVQNKALDDVAAKFDQGFLTGIRHLFTLFTGGWFEGPIGKIVTAVGAFAAAFAAAWFGLHNIIFRAVSKALNLGGIGGGIGSGPRKGRSLKLMYRRGKARVAAAARGLTSKVMGAISGAGVIAGGARSVGAISKAAKASASGATGAIAGGVKSTAKMGGKALGVAGGLLSAGFLYSDIKAIEANESLSKEEKSKAKTKAVAQTGGSLVGGFAGMKGGAAAGAAIGALFGGVGAIPGAIIGSILGGIGGSMLGETIAEKITDAVQDAPIGDYGALNAAGGSVVKPEMMSIAPATPTAPPPRPALGMGAAIRTVPAMSTGITMTADPASIMQDGSFQVKFEGLAAIMAQIQKMKVT